MAKIYYEPDADLSALKGKRMAVVGYGIQGRAQALNLRDSGLDVVVGLRRGGESWGRAKGDGVEVAEVSEAVRGADVVLVLIPDEVQPSVWKKEIEPNLKDGVALDWAHGFNITFRAIQPPGTSDVVMVAPKAPGRALRQEFLNGWGVPALLAVEQDYTGHARETALAIAKGLGSTRVGVIETTFREETETDLLGEQVDLCGGVTELIKTSFQVLVEEGYQPELAYFEVLHELKMIVDLIQAGGIEHMWANVSNTAEFGGRTRGRRVIDPHVRKNMEALLADIKSGAFAREWMAEYETGMKTMAKLREGGPREQIEVVGAAVRSMFAKRP
jgi:ketol-acid reductoisomerase